MYFQETLKSLFLMLLLATVLIGEAAEAQQVKGNVTGSDGESLPGVNIIVKGTSIGTATNFDGDFQLNVPSLQDTLIFSFIGFETREVPIQGRQELNISLIPASITGDELVVVGYGSQAKSDLTGSVSSIRGESLEDQNLGSVTEALQGRVAGVHVVQNSGEPGAGINLKIRGTSSLLGDNTPLYVVDGIPISTNTNASETLRNASNPLSNLNPDDIQSIEILKDASAVSIYGSRASNGVVLINTKQAKSGEIQIDFSSSQSISQVDRFYDRISGPEYARLENENTVFRNLPTTYDEMMDNGALPYDGVDDSGEPDPVHPLPENAPEGVDLFNTLFESGQSQDYDLSLSGGNEKYRQLINFNYSHQDGVIIQSGFKRAGLKYNSSLNIGEKFTLNTILNLTHTDKKRINTSFQSVNGGVIKQMIRFSPFRELRVQSDIPVLDEEGQPVRNPYLEIVGRDYLNTGNNGRANVQLEFNPTANLTLTSRFGGTYSINKIDDFLSTQTKQGYDRNGDLFKRTLDHIGIVSETFANYLFESGEHSFNSTLGVSYENVSHYRLNQRWNDFTFQDKSYNAPQYALQPIQYTGTSTNHTLQSGFFRLNYSLAAKYLFTFTSRADGSSRFSEGGRWGFFPSGAVAWRLSEEDFISDLNIFSSFKIRASYGQTGNQAIPPYGTLATIQSRNIAMGLGEVYTGSWPTRIANKELTWETSTSLDLGLEMGFFENRLNVEFDYYRKTTEDLLMNLPIPVQTGFRSVAKNVGSLKNEGMELALYGYPVDTGDFQWRTNFNISTNETIVTELGGLEYLETGRIGAGFNASPTRLYEGGSIGEFYVYEVKRLSQLSDFVDYQNDPTHEIKEGSSFIPFDNDDKVPGAWVFVDQNGDGIITADDKKIQGNANPDFIFGLSNDLSYKNFELSFFLQGSYGNDLLNVTEMMVNGATNAVPDKEYLENRWTLDNQHNNIKYPSYGSRINDKLSNVQIEDGSYVRLKNLKLKYNLNTSNIPFLRNLSVYASGTNLFTLTNYSGQDPEVSSLGSNVLAPGIDFGAYPRPKIYALGFNLGL